VAQTVLLPSLMTQIALWTARTVWTVLCKGLEGKDFPVDREAGTDCSSGGVGITDGSAGERAMNNKNL
jgi:hypothetical protein